MKENLGTTTDDNHPIESEILDPLLSTLTEFAKLKEEIFDFKKEQKTVKQNFDRR